ncbi:MAG TPA: DUF1122 family protein [Candidatus Binataceae bacterium]|nr:DUF1122 family protein [Candidatus Binataceae bacterium]
MPNATRQIAPKAGQIAEKLNDFELRGGDGSRFGLALRELYPVRARAGWLRFVLDLRDPQHGQSVTPLMTGFISGGGRGVMPWVEGRIYPAIDFAGGETFDARAAGLEGELIHVIGDLLPAGGHLMLEYESPGQGETHRELLLRVPPAATHLGALMFRAGFRGHFKDWYIAEGGNEGPRKLQANKSPDAAAARLALRANLEELRQFLRRPIPANPGDATVIERAKARARELIKSFAGNSPARKAAPARKSRG